MDTKRAEGISILSVFLQKETKAPASVCTGRHQALTWFLPYYLIIYLLLFLFHLNWMPKNADSLAGLLYLPFCGLLLSAQFPFAKSKTKEMLVSKVIFDLKYRIVILFKQDFEVLGGLKAQLTKLMFHSVSTSSSPDSKLHLVYK